MQHIVPGLSWPCLGGVGPVLLVSDAVEDEVKVFPRQCLEPLGGLVVDDLIRAKRLAEVRLSDAVGHLVVARGHAHVGAYILG
jgi:hypothetical protein